MQQVDDPPYLPVGTEVSAKYKGAFCEAKVRKVVRNIKCKVAYKHGLGTGTVSDDQIKCDLLRVGATVEVKHPDRREYVEATITKIQDYSQYTVVFDDGDITTLRRSALCLKSGRHFNESETLDQLPLTHPEHFGNPVIGGRRGRSLELYKKNMVRSRHTPDESSEEDEEIQTKPRLMEKEEHIGKIICVESTDMKKKGPKENWFPALVVAPTAQDTVRIRVKDEYLVRSFKDGRYYTVPKKEATEFTREQATKQDTVAVQAALEFLHNDCLPAHWDREVLFGLSNSLSDFYNEFDSDSSDDEPTEEKDHFVAQLYKYMDDRGTPLNKGPSIINKDVDLYRLYRAVQKLGGYNRVTTQNQWKQIAIRLGFVPTTTSIQNLVKQAYKKFLLPFEEFDRKLGCTMVAHPRANRIKGRSLVRASSVASPKPEKESKSTTSATEESENTSESSVDAVKPRTKPIGKVKTLIEQYEEKLDDIKQEQKDLKEKDLKCSKEFGGKRDRDSVPGIKNEASTSTSNRKEKSIKKEEKKGKKRIKDTENEKTKGEQSEKEKSCPANTPINVGDKLRVYYHEQKVTYEAKVIEISKSENVLFLVHYTGWNTRYDEWVPKERIAENLTSNKTNKRSKTGGKTETRSNSASSEKITGPSPVVRSKRNRVSSRNDVEQHPRSTTPSSIASNSSRTKSPATPAQHRRTTRGQPNKLRRTSNNTDISSLQTDSDSDSDEPVVKKPIAKKKSVNVKKKPKRVNIAETNEEIKKEKYSNASSEEEPLVNAVTQNKESETIQTRLELKGFNETNISAEEEIAAEHTHIEKQVELSSKSGSKPLMVIPFGQIQTIEVNDPILTGTMEFKAEHSFDSDSYGDDDFIVPSGTHDCQDHGIDIIEKVAPLKQVGIERFAKNTLAEKPISEKPHVNVIYEKPLYTKADPDKRNETGETSDSHTRGKQENEKPPHVEKKENDNEEIYSHNVPGVKVELDENVFSDIGAMDIIQSGDKIFSSSEDIPSTSSVSTNEEKLAEDVNKAVKTESIEQSMVKSDKSKTFGRPVKQSVAILKDHTKHPDEDVKEKHIIDILSSDIYEFKEPEPFEFEISKKSSPESEKKPKRKGPNDKPEHTKRCSTPPTKRIKKTVAKDSDRIFQSKSNEDEPSALTSNQIIPEHSSPTEVDSKSEAHGSIKCRITDTDRLPIDDIHQSVGTSTTRSRKCMNVDVHVNNLTAKNELPSLKTVPKTVRELQSQSKPLFISSFVETIVENKSKVFELNYKSTTRDKEVSDEDLESVKKIMLTDEVLNREPPKVDKPSSIADKVLKALNSQQQHSSSSNTSEVLLSECSKPDVVQLQDSHDGSSRPPIEIPPTIERNLIASDASPKPSLIYSSDVQPNASETPTSLKSKIDILESISPKNNDLSETIQKLESVIQKTGDQSHMSDDSSDSTDSEQRLIIEDESQNSELTSEIVLIKQENVGTKPAVDGRSNVNLKSCTVLSHTANDEPKIGEASKTEHIDQSHSNLISTARVMVFEALGEDEQQASENTEENLAGSKLDESLNSKNEDNSQTECVQNESLSLLLCEETIPGSPAPVSSKEQFDTSKKNYESLFTNPHGIEALNKSISVDHETRQSQKIGIKNPTPASSPRDSMSQDDSSEDVNKKSEQDRNISPKKRRCTRKQSELESMSKRRKPIVRRNTITGSDSEDNSDINATQRIQRPSKTCQYNFLVQLDPAMNSNQRIALLKKKIQDLRKTYNMIKTELASIDRRRKKLRRREREMKKSAQQSTSQIIPSHLEQQSSSIIQQTQPSQNTAEAGLSVNQD